MTEEKLLDFKWVIAASILVGSIIIASRVPQAEKYQISSSLNGRFAFVLNTQTGQVQVCQTYPARRPPTIEGNENYASEWVLWSLANADTRERMGIPDWCRAELIDP